MPSCPIFQWGNQLIPIKRLGSYFKSKEEHIIALWEIQNFIESIGLIKTNRVLLGLMKLQLAISHIQKFKKKKKNKAGTRFDLFTANT